MAFFIYGIIAKSYKKEAQKRLRESQRMDFVKAELTRTKVLHCRMELRVYKRPKIERSADAFRVAITRHLSLQKNPSYKISRRGIKMLGYGKLADCKISVGLV